MRDPGRAHASSTVGWRTDASHAVTKNDLVTMIDAPPDTARPAPPHDTASADALDLLARDHRAILRMFRDYQRLLREHGTREQKAEVSGQLCLRLSVHLQIEEEIFYPAARTALGDAADVDEALVDHHGVAELIARLDEMEPDAADFDATVAVLEAWIVPHMRAEQDELFPQLRRSGLDTLALGHRLSRRRRALQQDVTRIGLPAPAPRGEPRQPSARAASSPSATAGRFPASPSN